MCSSQATMQGQLCASLPHRNTATINVRYGTALCAGAARCYVNCVIMPSYLGANIHGGRVGLAHVVGVACLHVGKLRRDFGHDDGLVLLGVILHGAANNSLSCPRPHGVTKSEEMTNRSTCASCANMRA